jgi:hypothetical protein
MTGQLTNTLAIGTAPFVITSTTRVANLNVATAGTADTLTTARTIGGVSFNGSANINLPGVNTAGNQNTTGNAATATTATNQSGGTVNATTIVASTSILPAADNTGVVGNSTSTWSNGQFTNLTVDSTLNVRAAIDLADSDTIRFGSSDDAYFVYNGTPNTFELQLEAAAVSFIITDNGTTRFTFTKSTGNFAATSFTGVNGGTF